MSMILKITKHFLVLGIALLSFQTAHAASLFFVPGSGEFNVGRDVVVDLKIDSEGAGINAAQATIRFPKDTLSVKAIDKTDSTFNFWLEDPTFSNENGVISFVGGTPYGISGASLQVVRITFTTKGSGSAPISLVDAAVTASDGSGTNVLYKTTDAALTISPTAIIAAPVIVPAPQQITREPEAARGLPILPVVRVPLHPTPSEWHNASNVFTAAWDLPRDIASVATALNHEPFFEPTESEGLFENKSFAALTDGVWYLHVQFKNNIGWGPVAHYRIAVDTKTPLPFTVTARTGESTDNPAPLLEFRTSDALSGLKSYEIRIDSGSWITVPLKGFTGTHKLPPQEPGKHRITVRALDQANNSIEDSIDIEILAIASPILTLVTDRIFTDALQGVTIKGTALPSTEVLLTLDQEGAMIASSTTPVDEHGNWEYTFGDPLRNGTYYAHARTRDARGALSLVVESPKIVVGDRPILQIGGLELGKGAVITLLILILLGGFGGGYWFYKKRQEKVSLRLEVAQRDAANIFKMIQSDVQKLQDAQKTPTPADDEFIADKLKKNVEKMGSYVEKEIERVKE